MEQAKSDQVDRKLQSDGPNDLLSGIVLFPVAEYNFPNKKYKSFTCHHVIKE